MKITRTALRVLAPAAAILAAALAGCGNNASASLPPGTRVTPSQSAAQIASEEQMRQQHNAKKNQ